MKTLITSVALAMLFAVTANADVIHTTDYEADGAAGTGLNIAPGSMEFTDGGGDFAGLPGLGISDTNANSGSYSYVVDTSQTVDNSNGWGGNWSGMNSTSGQTSGGFTDQATAIANGSGCYIDYTEGATFTVSVWAATDAAGVTSGATLAPRLEFQGAAGELFRNDAGATAASTLTETFQLFTHSYTITAADEAMGIQRVTGVIGTDGLGFNATTGGNVYFDDFTFEVNSANVVLVGNGHSAAIPEPSTASLLLAGLMGLCGVRRRKS